MRCVISSDTSLHARPIGGAWVDQTDLAPSVTLAVVSFLAIGAVLWRYRQHRAHGSLTLAIAALCLGVAFSIRAALTNSADYSPATLTAEQAFFLLALTFLLWGHILFSRSFVRRAALIHWPSTLLILAAVVLLVAVIIGLVALAQSSDAPAAWRRSGGPFQADQMRVASAALELAVAVLHALLLPLAKIVAPELPFLELGLLDLSAWFLFVPAFYLFCITAVTDDSSPLVCSQIFFYLASGLFPLLALAVLVALPFPRWGFGLVPRDLLAGAGFLPGVRDAEEARLLREARELVAGEGGHGPYDDWSLRLR